MIFEYFWDAINSLGLIGKKTGERAARFSDWCWFLATIVALVELGSERNITKSRIHAGRTIGMRRLNNSTTTLTCLRLAESRLYADSVNNPNAKAGAASASSKLAQQELEKLHRQDYWLRMQRLKLVMDLVFVCEYYNNSV